MKLNERRDCEVLSARLHHCVEGGLSQWNGWAGALLHWCPACSQRHPFFPQDMPSEWTGHRWKYDGNAEQPTFEPSMNISWGDGPGARRCHYTITAGKVQFHNDCSHAYAGRVVQLADMPAPYA